MAGSRLGETFAGAAGLVIVVVEDGNGTCRTARVFDDERVALAFAAGVDVGAELGRADYTDVWVFPRDDERLEKAGHGTAGFQALVRSAKARRAGILEAAGRATAEFLRRAEGEPAQSDGVDTDAGSES